MKIKKFIKKNYKKLIIQFVSVLSALILFSVPCCAASEQVIDTTGIYPTTYFINRNVTNTEPGINVYKITRGFADYGATGSVVTVQSISDMSGVDMGDSVNVDNLFYFITFTLPKTISIEPNHSYTFELPLVYLTGDSNSDYNVKSDFIRLDLWDNSKISNILFVASTTNSYTWNYSKNTEFDTWQKKVFAKLTNYSEDTYNANYLRLFVRFQGPGRMLMVGSAIGFYDSIKVIDNGKVYQEFDGSIIDRHNLLENQIFEDNQAGINSTKEVFNAPDLFLNFGTGLLAVTEVMHCFAFDGTWLSSVLDVSLVLGLFAFVLGMTVLIIKGGGRK